MNGGYLNAFTKKFNFIFWYVLWHVDLWATHHPLSLSKTFAGRSVVKKHVNIKMKKKRMYIQTNPSPHAKQIQYKLRPTDRQTDTMRGS